MGKREKGKADDNLSLSILIDRDCRVALQMREGLLAMTGWGVKGEAKRTNEGISRYCLEDHE